MLLDRTAPLVPPIEAGSTDRTPPSSSRRHLLVLAAPGLALGFLTALTRLLRPSLWYDEASSVGAINDLTGTARQSGGTMAPYYAVLRLWSTVSLDPVWLRTLSLLFGLGALICSVHLARRWLSDAWAAWTGVFIALSYLWADQAGEARSYTMLMLLLVCSWTVLDDLLTLGDGDRRSRLALAYFALWVVLPPTQGLAVLVLGAQAACLLVARPSRSTWAAAVPGIVGGLLVAGASSMLGAGGVTNWIPATSTFGMLRLILVATAPSTELAVILGVVLGFAIWAAARGWVSADTPITRFRTVAPVFWGLLPGIGLLVLSLETPLLVPRYLVCAVPGMAMSLAIGVRAIGATAGPRRRDVATIGGLTVVLFCLAMAQVAVRVVQPDRWDEVASIIESRGHDGDGLLLPERRNRVPFEAAWKDDAPVALEPLDFDRPLGEVRYVEPERSRAQTVRSLAGRQRVWLVFEHVFDPSTEALHALERSPAFSERYRLVRTWDVESGIEVRLYRRR